MSRLTQQYLSQTHLQMAGASITFIPILIVFLLLQRNFIQRIALSGLKGWRAEAANGSAGGSYLATSAAI